MQEGQITSFPWNLARKSYLCWANAVSDTSRQVSMSIRGIPLLQIKAAWEVPIVADGILLPVEVLINRMNADSHPLADPVYTVSTVQG